MNKSSRPRHRLLRAVLPLFLFLFGCFTPPPQQPVGPTIDEANIAILGEVDRLAPGSQAGFLVQVRAPYTRQRWPNAPVEVYLNDPSGESRQVFGGVTGADGIAHVSFRVPDTIAVPEQVLEIRSTIPADGSEYSPYAGEYRTYRDVYIGRTYNVLVSSDKPVYQPGQVIHLRGLALDSLDLHAASGLTMTVTVADPQGNKLMRREIQASEYGIASADFPLDSQASSGDYTITAVLGPFETTRTVEVKPYSLPRFEVTFHPGSTFYLPGETATGTVEARYFFGKPLAGAAVAIAGTVDDGRGERTVVELSGVTDANGIFAYEFAVPESFRGELDNKSIDIDLEITVTDTANHPESIDESVTVAEKPLLIEAVPESGRLRRGLDDRVYLDVSYPDGVAARATVTVTDALSQTFTAVTDDYGQAAITLTTPNDGLTPLVVTADDGRGRVVEQPLLLPSEGGDSQLSLLLRPGQAEYRLGDMLNVDILVAGENAGESPVVYLDIVKDRQTFGLAPLPVTNGVAQAAIEIDGSLLGTLELNAYAADAAGQIAADRRYVLVNPPPAEVSVTADKQEYRPGETATLDIEVTREGTPLQAAVGIAIVDESVFAIEEVDSRFARTYFLLNRELQEPRYGLHEFMDLKSDAPSPYDGAPDSIQYAYMPGSELRGTAQSRQVALMGMFAEFLAEDADAAEAITKAATDAHAQHPLPQPLNPWALASAWGNRLYLLAPLLGVALYDGTRNRRRLLIGLVVFSLGAFVWGACASPGAAPVAPAAPAAEGALLEGSTTSTQAEKPPRLRQFFPETMYWMPELVTDEEGRAQIEVPMADSITTWRASLLVSDKEGNLGSSELGLRVFQDFFVEPDLPRFLTVGDEIDVPIAVYNYLPEPQAIELSVAPADWFELRGEPALAFAAGANEVMAAYLPIRVTQYGSHALQITARGKDMGDAVLREVEVLPDGQAAAEVSGGKLEGSTQITLPLPSEAIKGTGRVTVKVYGGVVSQVLAGLEGMLQMPYGCFEQTSSATYPNVLVLDYLRRTGQANGRIELQARHLVGLGYQRLLGFEVDGEPGGFSLYGDPPADPMLTAYGVQEFADMARVAYVDPEILARMVDFLAERQNRDGSWEPRWGEMGEAADRDNRLGATAYVAWGLADAGYGDDRSVRRALRYLERSLEQSSSGSAKSAISTYTLALIANALIAAGEDATPAVEQLSAQAHRTDGGAYWTPGTQTYLGSYGLAGDIETTALAVQALLRSGGDEVLAQAALDYLVSNRDANGSFYTTHATIQALKALLLAADANQEQGAAVVTITLRGQDGSVRTETITVDDSNQDLLRQAVFDDAVPGAVLALEVQGDRPLDYQIITEYYLSWQEAEAAAFAPAPMRIAVTYDRSKAQVNDMVGVRADVELLMPEGAGTLIVDLGLPPGFAPVTQDLDALVTAGLVERYELTGRQIILYLSDVQSGRVYTFEYRLQARTPASVQAPASQVYDYYAPDQQAMDPPQRITVELGTP